MKQQWPFTEDTFKLILTAAVVVLAGAFLWLAYRVDHLSSRVAESTPVATKALADKQYSSGWNTTITSGKGAFSVTLPDGWGPLLKPTNGDALLLPGTKQPEVAAGKATKVNEVAGYGTDSLQLFSINLFDKGFAAPPRGEAADFSIGKGDEAIAGKKYIYHYSRDEIVGIGYLRLQNDRDYEYVLPVGEKEIHVYYHVYGADPRNQIDVVDDIVRTLRTK